MTKKSDLTKETNQGIKLTEIEIKLATELNTKRAKLQQEIVGIGIQQLNLDLRQEQVEELYRETVQLEKQLTDTFTSKYGNGSIDLERGEFIPV